MSEAISAGPVYQFGRKWSLVIADNTGAGLDLSQFRVKFNVKRTGVMTPNSADIRVYNLDLSTAAKIRDEFTQVVLQAGYEGNYGKIFVGNIKQTILGRENSTDTFVDIIAGDGDAAYIGAVMNTSFSAGTSASDHLNAAQGTLTPKGVTAGFTGPLPGKKLPRGKVMYGMTRDYIKKIANDAGFTASIQDGQLVMISEKTYLPGQVVVLTSKTGMIGTPQQTIEGVNCRCLLNPGLKINGRFQIDNASVAQFAINLSVLGSPANTPAPFTQDGVYYIIVAEHIGDTRGTEWYTNLVGITVQVSANPANALQVGNGGS